MKYGFVCALSAVALAACGGETVGDADGDGTVTNEEARAVAEAAGDAIKPEPGKYKTTMTLIKAEIPGAPPEMVEMMGGMMGGDYEFCLTPEMAEKGFGESLKEGQDDSCNISKFNINGNDIDMAMTCNEAETGNVAITMTGTVGATESDMTMTSKGTMPGMGEANFEMNMKQVRIGDCDA